MCKQAWHCLQSLQQIAAYQNDCCGDIPMAKETNSKHLPQFCCETFS